MACHCDGLERWSGAFARLDQRLVAHPPLAEVLPQRAARPQRLQRLGQRLPQYVGRSRAVPCAEGSLKLSCTFQHIFYVYFILCVY